MLLDLPPELLQLVLHQTTTPSFLQAALTCSTIFKIASNCREVVLYHLNVTPGIKLGLEDLNTPDLFRLLRRRAAQHLYGINLSADQTVYRYENHNIDVRASALGSCCSPNVALVLKGSPLVHLYDASNGIWPREWLEPPHADQKALQVVKVAFSMPSCVSVLYRYSPAPDTYYEDEHPFVEQAMGQYKKEGYHLVHYRLGRSDRLAITFCALQTRHKHYYPVALAVANRLRVAISWRSPNHPSSNEVVLYTAYEDPSDSSNLPSGSNLTCG